MLGLEIRSKVKSLIDTVHHRLRGLKKTKVYKVSLGFFAIALWSEIKSLAYVVGINIYHRPPNVKTLITSIF